MSEWKWDVYVYGDVNVDVIVPGVEKLPPPGQEQLVPAMETCVGGGGALFAMGLGKLGLCPVLKGRVGDDCHGRMIREQLAAAYVDTSLLEVARDGKTGISLSFTNERDRCFLTFPGISGVGGGSRLAGFDLGQAGLARHIHLTGYEGEANQDIYETMLGQIKASTKATVSFDVGWDPSGQWSQGIWKLLPFIDILFMNETEAIHYSRASSAKEAATAFAKTCGQAVVKMGGNGALAVQGNQACFQPAWQVQAVDATGAGDSFNAGYVYAFLQGFGISERLKYGNGCGALSVTALGGNGGFPTKEELSSFFQEKSHLLENGQ